MGIIFWAACTYFCQLDYNSELCLFMQKRNAKWIASDNNYRNLEQNSKPIFFLFLAYANMLKQVYLILTNMLEVLIVIW